MKKVNKIILLSVLCLVFVTCFAADSYAEITIFKTFAERTTKFAIGLRGLAFAISGFGIVMFTFLAICGKINFKHLGYIMISLFFLSGVGLMISYMTGGDARSALQMGGNLYNISKTAVSRSTSL